MKTPVVLSLSQLQSNPRSPRSAVLKSARPSSRSGRPSSRSGRPNSRSGRPKTSTQQSRKKVIEHPKIELDPSDFELNKMEEKIKKNEGLEQYTRINKFIEDQKKMMQLQKELLRR